AYESSLKYYRDLKNVIDTAREEGREEGRQEGEQIGYQRAVLNMLNHGIPAAEVAKLMNLTLQDVATIKQANKMR
ncbi:MAG: hypothetical protein RQ715_10740, partial [Methylococcales bacterium]|nr:hypothetical protein [Methylococcales bacterium]